MNMVLDTTTLFRVSALLALMLASITWMLLGRPRRGASLVWCFGGWLVGLSVGLISLRGFIPEFWSYSLAQTVYLASLLVLAQSLRMDMQRPWPWPWLMAVLLVYGVVIALGFDDKRSQGLAVLVRLANCAALLALTTSAFMLARLERSRNAWFITLGCGLLTVCMVLVTVATMQGQANLHTMRESVFNQMLGGLSLLTLLMTHTGYLGRALEHSLRRNAVLQQAQWQAQQRRERSQALALLDRQRTLSVLANSLGHGILQPLTATLLNVQMARRTVVAGAADAELVRQMLSSAVDGLRRSAALIERIRAFLRPALGSASVLALQSVVHDAENLLRQELMYRKVSFRVRMPEAMLWVRAEPLAMTQALLLVLRNAMQAVQPQQQPLISLSLQTNDREAWIEVTDSGPGFPATMQIPGLTGVFPAQDWQGGLGLYMARDILSQSGGRLMLSNSPAGGACVRLVLPLASSGQG